jgi:hypothetical protein
MLSRFWQDVIFGSVKGLSSLTQSSQRKTVALFNAFIKMLVGGAHTKEEEWKV